MALNSNELMKGNYVDFNGNIAKIFEIRENHARIEYIRSDTGLKHSTLVEYDRLDPITLTDELLVKFGFVMTDLYGEFELKKFKTNNIYCGFVVRLDYPIHGTVLYGYTNPHNIRYVLLQRNLKYFHTFQNLYLGLTENQLETKN
jgi:hypothetical protein